MLVLAAMPAGTARAEDRPSELREKKRLTAAAYLHHGFSVLERPRPVDQEEAERLFRKALALDPRLAAAHVGLSRASAYVYTLGIDETTERADTARREAEKALQLSPGDAAAHAALALALAAGDRLTPALEEARRAVAADERSVDAQIALCIILRLRRELEPALEAGRRAATLDPESPRALVALAEALRETGRHADALEIFGQAIDLDHESVIPQLGAAATRLKSGDVMGARRAYQIILNQWDFAQDRARLGLAALLVQLQDHEAALGQYGSLTIPEGHALPALLALYGKGYCLLKLGRDAEAEYFLSSLLDRTPQDYDGPARGREILFRATLDLIDYFQGRGRDRKVEYLLRSACERPMAPTRLARRFAGLLDQHSDRARGAELLERAIQGADPNEDPLELTDSLLDLAHRRFATGRRRPADDSPVAACLHLVTERISSCQLGLAHYRLARAQSLARVADAALRSLERARDLGYLPADLLSREADLDPLRQEPGFQVLLKSPEPSKPANP